MFLCQSQHSLLALVAHITVNTIQSHCALTGRNQEGQHPLYLPPGHCTDIQQSLTQNQVVAYVEESTPCPSISSIWHPSSGVGVLASFKPLPTGGQHRICLLGPPQSTTCIGTNFAVCTLTSSSRHTCSHNSPSLASTSLRSTAPSNRERTVSQLWQIGTWLRVSAAPLSTPFWYSKANSNEASMPTHLCPVASKLGVVRMYVKGLLPVLTTNGA